MSSTNKTSLGLNMWEASDKPVRQDFINDNVIIDEKITQLNSNLDNVNSNLYNVNSNLNNKLESSKVFFVQDCKAMRFLIADRGGSSNSVAQIDFYINDAKTDYYRLEFTKTGFQFVSYKNGQWG